jgi:hypothetical protein
MDDEQDIALGDFDPLLLAGLFEASYDMADIAAAEWRAFFGREPTDAQRSVLLDQSVRTLAAGLEATGTYTVCDLLGLKRKRASEKQADDPPAGVDWLCWNLLTTRSAP